MARHKWQYTQQPWTARCLKCGCRQKMGRVRRAMRHAWNRPDTVRPVLWSTDGKAWREGDPPACTGVMP